MLAPGDELAATLAGWAGDHHVGAATVVGIGAAQHASLAFYDRTRFEYDPLPVDEQVEVVSLNGSITRFEDAPRIHLHAVLSRPDGSCIAGHVVELVVWPTLELFVEEYPGDLVRRFDDGCRLPTIRPAARQN